MLDHTTATDDAIRFMRSLGAGSADCVVTDPPYSSGGFNESQRRDGSSTSEVLPWLTGDALGTLAMAHLLREFALEARRVVRPGGSMHVFCDWKMAGVFAPVIESAGWRYRSLIVWDKGNPGSGQGFRPAHEFVLHFADPSTQYLAHPGNVIRCPRVPNAEREHATQKPVDLLVALLQPICPRGGVIVDPFSGSGSIIEAAERIGAVAWTCDADPAHRPAAERRARGAMTQPELEGL